ncbi:hypothetical protein IFM89_032287 [Coptis chinensis]|uniref:Uncharacterized protein n=1 Tax=Coptis chinensis TaxID=261450 RepID=A0A835GZG3_9MAGN|nr:hypothetical protein IFM89_032287 [Coptis chinensis]
MEIYVVSRVTASLLTSLHFFGVDLAVELDVGKGIAATVASIKNSKGESALHLGYEHIVLVHYRETSEDSPVTPVNSNYASSYSDTSVPRPLSDETDSEASHALYMGSDTSFVGESVEPSSIVSVQNHEKRLHEINTLEWEDLLLSNAPNNVNIDRRGESIHLMFVFNLKLTWEIILHVLLLQLTFHPSNNNIKLQMYDSRTNAQLEECVDKDAAEKSDVVKEATKAIFTPNADKTVSKGNGQIQEK